MSSLEQPTLVLNKSWQPINACIAKDALRDVFAERAKILHPVEYVQYDIDDWIRLPVADDESFIRTVNGRIKVPEIIVLRNYDKVRNQPVIFSRRNLWRRDRFHCQYCGKRPPPDEVTIDHILPKSRGGTSCFSNCVLACIECNTKKNNRTPEEAGMKLIRLIKKQDGTIAYQNYAKPKTPRWSPIFSVHRAKMPASWAAFVQNLINDMYWDTELEA